MKKIIENLIKYENATVSELLYLISNFKDSEKDTLAKAAVEKRNEVYGNKVFLRGLLEIGNACHNDCFYCGIRKSNENCQRYELSEKEVLKACEKGNKLGLKTFVLQGGETKNDGKIERLIYSVKEKYSDCAITLSLGEKDKKIYKAFKDAGADRYLLRHETIDCEHYSKLHPIEMSFENRKKCLYDLKDLGYQVGCGFMVGSPYQEKEHLAKELLFIKEFSPHMVGIGPFIPHKDTPFGHFEKGSVNLTLLMLSLIRIMNKKVLLPATTALATASEDGRVMGINSGANVVMPNLTPHNVKDNYSLYDNKVNSGAESVEGLDALSENVKKANCIISFERGDSLV